MEYIQGQVITHSFIIDKITVNDKFAEIMLKHNDGSQILGILKDNVDLFAKTYSLGENIVCKGKVRKRRKFNCLDIVYISKRMQDEEVSITDKFDVEKYKTRFEELVNLIIDKDYKLIIDNCLNEDVKELYFTYPAAKNNHHNYLHGLLQHSIEVVDIALLISNYFKNVNNDLLICAGLLHDIGKLKSYDIGDEQNLESMVTPQIKIVKTDWDSFLGHLPMSAIFLSKTVPQDFDSHKAMLLYHMLLSHHGELNFGSPVTCKTKESYILYKADEMSSMIHHIDSLSFKKDNWSEYDEINKRCWYKEQQ